jgi:hypothetical protein
MSIRSLVLHHGHVFRDTGVETALTMTEEGVAGLTS